MPFLPSLPKGASLLDLFKAFPETSGLIHSGDSQIARSSSSSHYESRNCGERHAGRSTSA